jgi:hypothetical protein
MMKFKKYPHLERLGTDHVEGIELGTTYVFPKLDGSNASVWITENNAETFPALTLECGSRNRQLNWKLANLPPETLTTGDFEADNAGFAQSLYKNDPVRKLLEEYTSFRLFGEWLVPHTLQNYRKDCWRKFYVFDVFSETQDRFLTYEEYQPILEKYGVEYIPCIKKIQNGTYEMFKREADNCKYLLDLEKFPDAKGEGVVIKNYDWRSKNGSYTSAKIVLQEFKDENAKVFGPTVISNVSNAQLIADKACTETLVEKEYQKIVLLEKGWSSKLIPRLLHTVYYSVVTEELWNCLKEVKSGSVNFKELQNYCILKVKQFKPEVF